MRKQVFLKTLKKELSGLPKGEIEERLAFYAEISADEMEEGLTEEQAVAKIGSPFEIASQIKADYFSANGAKEKIVYKRRAKTWEVVLLAVGSPLWLSLIVAAVAVVVAFYASLWAIVISVWACVVAFAVSAPVCLIAGVCWLCIGNTASGVGAIGLSLVLAGFSILFYYGGKALAKGGVMLTKIPFSRIKNRIVKKGE